MAQLPHDPLRVGIFYRLTWLRCLRLEKALLPRLGCGLRVLQLETWFGPLHQSHTKKYGYLRNHPTVTISIQKFKLEIKQSPFKFRNLIENQTFTISIQNSKLKIKQSPFQFRNLNWKTNSWHFNSEP
jgi:hypothetical protein